MMTKRHNILAFIMIAALSITACNSSKQSTDSSDKQDVDNKKAQVIENKVINNETAQAKTNDTEEMNEQKRSKDYEYGLIVSFISIGEGTSLTAKDKLQNLLNFLDEDTGKSLECDTVAWGREGEVDYCFILDELNEEQQIKFVNDVKETFAEDELIHVEQNTVCQHYR